MKLFSCLSKKSSLDAVYRGASETKEGPRVKESVATKVVHVNDNISCTTPATRTTLTVPDSFSPGTSLSLSEALNGSFELILHAEDEKFLEFVEQVTSNGTTSVSDIPPHIHQPPSMDTLSPVSAASENRNLSLASTTERLDQIQKKVVEIQFENEAMKAIIVRLLALVKKLKTQGGLDSSPTATVSNEESQLIQELSLKLTKQEEQLEKQRVKYEKLKAKLTEKKKSCQSLLKGIVITTEDSESVPRSCTIDNDPGQSERLHFEKELDVLEVEVRCLQKELSSSLDQIDHMREEDKLNKQLIEALRKELDEKNALIESLTLPPDIPLCVDKPVSSSSSSHELTDSDESKDSRTASAAQDMLQELAAIVQFNQHSKKEVEDVEEPPAMSKYLQLRRLQEELSRSQRQVRDQQRELKALASNNGIAEFMKLWRSEKEVMEKRIYELEQDLQRSIISRHDASFYSAEESSITSGSSHTISSQQSERSPRPISPSYFLNAQVGWPPIPLDLLQGIEIRPGNA